MNEVIELVNLISKVNEEDKDAREKLRLYFTKLFLAEKRLSDLERRNLQSVCAVHLLKKNVYECNVKGKFYPNNSLEAFVKFIREEIDMDAYKRGLTMSLYNDCYYELCSVVSHIVIQRLKQRDYKVKEIFTEDLGISNVPHRCVGVFQNDSLDYLVDLTFKQFMTVPFFIPERIYHLRNSFLSPASFSDIEFFRELCIKGFFKATPENIKTYYDGFWCANASYKNEDALVRGRIKKPEISGEEYIKQISDIALR